MLTARSSDAAKTNSAIFALTKHISSTVMVAGKTSRPSSAASKQPPGSVLKWVAAPMSSDGVCNRQKQYVFKTRSSSAGKTSSPILASVKHDSPSSVMEAGRSSRRSSAARKQLSGTVARLVAALRSNDCVWKPEKAENLRLRTSLARQPQLCDPCSVKAQVLQLSDTDRQP